MINDLSNLNILYIIILLMIILLYSFLHIRNQLLVILNIVIRFMLIIQVVSLLIFMNLPLRNLN